MMVLHPAELNTPNGHVLLCGLAVVLVGIVICARAGALRDRDQKASSPTGAKGAFAAGFLICIASGILSPMLNIGFSFGEPIQKAAAAHGAVMGMDANSIWVPGLAGGFLINAGYSIYLLCKNKTWGLFTAGGTTPWHWIGSALMGTLWFGGMSIYGIGTAMMGPLGKVVGWPVFMSVVIVTANVNGLLSGEWKGAKTSSIALAWGGIALLVLAIIVVRGAA
jgi:L-rhamnose-H+ transport protein